jgi:hypothetical protein
VPHACGFLRFATPIVLGTKFVRHNELTHRARNKSLASHRRIRWKSSMRLESDSVHLQSKQKVKPFSGASWFTPKTDQSESFIQSLRVAAVAKHKTLLLWRRQLQPLALLKMKRDDQFFTILGSSSTSLKRLSFTVQRV